MLREEPLLGLATTKELLEELAVRMEITQNTLAGKKIGELCRDALDNLSDSVLNYRTVDGD